MDHSRDSSSLYLTDRSLLVGCEREHTQIRDHLADVLNGHGRLVLVSGGAGIGKTRIAEEMADVATQHNAQVVWSQCYAWEGAPAYWPQAPTAGEQVTLEANGSTPLDVNVTYAWQVLSPTPGYVICVVGQPCDQYSAPVYGETITQTFGNGGIWQVRLTATDSEGRITSRIFPISVGSGGPPIVALAPTNVLTGTVDQDIALGGSITHGGASELVKLWVDWGDGSWVNVAERSPTWQTIDICHCVGLDPVAGSQSHQYLFWGTHRFTQTGTYTVTLRVQSPGGVTIETTQVTIQTPPSVEWPIASPTTYGTALSVAHLNASAQDADGLDVPGTFTYTANGVPVAPGDVLPVGQHSLSATFVPDDQVNFVAPAVTTATLQVDPRSLTVSAPNLTMRFGATTLPNINAVTYDGWAFDDDASALGGTLACALTNGGGTAVSLSASTPLGTYTVTCSGLTSENYAISWADGRLKVTPTYRYLSQMTTHAISNRGVALMASNLVATAERLIERGGIAQARVVLLSYEVLIRLAQGLRMISSADATTLINLSRTL